MTRVQVYHGDSREILRALPDNSIDAVVTDPPYALVSIVNRFGGANAKAAKSEGASGVYARASAGFMGRSWDTGETAFDPAFWFEVMRVVKPGGWLVASSGTRTYHRLACAVEDGGWEIRDMVAWLYGTGFPKSKNIAKAIAQWRVEDGDAIRVVCRYLRAAMDAKGLKSRQLVGHFGDCNARLIDHWAARDTDSQPNLPTLDQWLTLKGVLELGDDLDSEVIRLNGRKGQFGDAWAHAEVIGEHEGEPGGFGDERFKVRDASIRELSGEAGDWDGYGTALKPALEPCVLARKPMIGTLAQNVLEHGVGALNIDACRIDTGERWAAQGVATGGVSVSALGDGLNNSGRAAGHGLGRWPANVAHDGSAEVVAAFPEAPGQRGLVRGGEPSPAMGATFNPRARVASGDLRPDQGETAARFFYSAKADDEDRLGSDHPTVKPVEFMGWLIRLICPPGGVVLDPFAGSGTTGLAAMSEGRTAILIEREADHADDIRRRLAWAAGDGGLTRQEILRHKLAKDPAKAEGADLPLFAEGVGHD